MHTQDCLTLLEFIEIRACYAFEFLDELTLLAVSRSDDCVYKFTRESSSTVKWERKTEKVEIEAPKLLKCIGDNVYVSNETELHLIKD